MQESHTEGMVSKEWIQATRTAFLDCLHPTGFPELQRHGERGLLCAYPEWLIMLLIQLGGKKDPFYIRPFEAIMTPDAQTILLATKRSWRCLVPSPLPCRSRRRTIKRC